jgi:hypothetical protein
MHRLMAEVKPDWESSIGALMRETLGSDKRRAFAMDVATAGPIDCDGYLRHAAKIGGEEGRALAAAVFQRLDQLAEQSPDIRKRCTISKNDVAEALIGAQVRAARQCVEAIGILNDEIAHEAAELDGREVSQLARDSLRMRRHNFDKQFPEEMPEAGEEN